jgi:hypothetical protein
VPPDIDDVAAFLGGFVAAEGCCSGDRAGSQFVFELGLGTSDRPMCVAFLDLFGVGHVHDSPRRRAHYDDESTYAVRSLRDLVEVVVPFMDEHLPPSYKRTQYLAWKERLLDYWEHRAKRVRPCEVEGCEAPRRAHGLCRRHLYVYYRQ